MLGCLSFAYEWEWEIYDCENVGVLRLFSLILYVFYGFLV